MRLRPDALIPEDAKFGNSFAEFRLLGLLFFIKN